MIPIKAEYPDNVFPEEFPEMREISLEVYRRMENAGKQMLRAIALYLGLKETYFDDKVKNGNSILRAIHYYPIANPMKFRLMLYERLHMAISTSLLC
jgi:isopenicillin N synthase-like dioxygenase